MTWWTRVDKLTDSQTEDMDQCTPTFTPSDGKALPMEMEIADGVQETRTAAANSKEDDSNDDDMVRGEEGKCHRWFDFICGIPTASSKSREKPEVTEDQRKEFLRESHSWSTFLTVNAAIAMCVMAFLTGFYH